MLKCNYAWGHLDFLQGEYAPCFRFKIKKQPIASMSDTLPSEAVNCTAMQEVRQSLQSGVFPPGCEDCEYKERHNIKSYRQKSLSNKLDVDYTSTVIPKIVDLELKFSRTCNFYCRHCMADSNSQFEKLGTRNPDIDSQLQKLNFDHLGIGDSPIQTISQEHLEDIIQNILPGVNKITFSGGEPLYHLGHYRFLERLAHDPNIDTTQLTIAYNTNMSMTSFKGFELANLWKFFKNVELTISMDGTGDLFNYFRQGGDYQTIVDNLFDLLDKCSNISGVGLVCTSTSYHAFYADEILQDLQTLVDRIRDLGISADYGTTFVHYPAGLDIANLEQRVKNKLNEKMNADNPIIKYMQTPSSADTSLFPKIVELQDKLHKRTGPSRIYNYVYQNKLDF